MPDSPHAAANKQLVGVILMISAAVLGVMAMLTYTGIVPLPEETRPMAALIVGIAAVADFGVGVMFFRMGQSS
ncbi:MAG: hypothetical protein ACRD1W_02880 [Vicinamibacterales bacterium]